MNKNWPGITTEMTAAVKELRAGTPSVMKEFSALARAASEPKALDIKTKELIALAISVATRCDPCIAFHAQSAVKQGAYPRGSHGGHGHGGLYGRWPFGHVCRASSRGI